MIDTTLPSDKILEELIIKITVSKKIKTVDNKIEQNKAQYDLDGQNAKVSASSSANVTKYEFLTGKDVLPEKDLLEIAATIKRFEYSTLRSELRKQSSIAEKQYQKLDKVFESKTEQKTKEVVLSQI